MAFQITKLGSGYEVDLLLGLGFEICISDITHHGIKSIELPYHQCNMHDFEGDDATVNPDHLDLLVSFGRVCAFPKVLEHVIVKQIVDLNLLRICPLGVSCFGLELARLLGVAWNLHSELVAHTASLPSQLHLLDSSLQNLFTACKSLKKLPTICVGKIMFACVNSACNRVVFAHDVEWFPGTLSVLPLDKYVVCTPFPLG